MCHPFTQRLVKGSTGPTGVRDPEKGEEKHRPGKKMPSSGGNKRTKTHNSPCNSESNHNKKEPLMADNRRINAASVTQKESSYFGQIV